MWKAVSVRSIYEDDSRLSLSSSLYGSGDIIAAIRRSFTTIISIDNTDYHRNRIGAGGEEDRVLMGFSTLSRWCGILPLILFISTQVKILTLFSIVISLKVKLNEPTIKVK